MRLSVRPHLRGGLVFLGSLLALSGAAQRPATPTLTRHANAAKPVASERIPLEVLPSGHIVVKATVNGVEGRFFLDTGAGITVVTHAFAQRVSGLQPQDGHFVGLRATGDRLDLSLLTARKFGVGSLVISNLTLGEYEGNMGDVDGLVSLTVFRHQPFTIEYSHRTLVLETPASLAQRRQAGRAVDLQLSDTYGQSLDMAAYCRVNNKLTVLAELDSGSPASQYWLNAAFAPTLGIDTVGLKHTTFPSDMGPHHRAVLYQATLQKLTPVGQPGIALTEASVGLMTGLTHDALLPLNWLGDQLTIDLPHRVLFAR